MFIVFILWWKNSSSSPQMKTHVGAGQPEAGRVRWKKISIYGISCTWMFHYERMLRKLIWHIKLHVSCMSSLKSIPWFRIHNTKDCGTKDLGIGLGSSQNCFQSYFNGESEQMMNEVCYIGTSIPTCVLKWELGLWSWCVIIWVMEFDTW